MGDAHADVLDQAWPAAHEILDPYDRAMALITMWGFGTPRMQGEIIPAVLEAVRDIEDEYDRASGISAFAPLLASEEMPAVLPAETQVLREALLATCQLDAWRVRSALLLPLAEAWCEVQPAEVAYTLWCEVLLLLSRRPLPDLLSDLAALVPVLTALGGQPAAREAAEAVSAARSWPPPARAPDGLSGTPSPESARGAPPSAPRFDDDPFNNGVLYLYKPCASVPDSSSPRAGMARGICTVCRISSMTAAVRLLYSHTIPGLTSTGQITASETR